jgi:hypothetical protein
MPSNRTRSSNLTAMLTSIDPKTDIRAGFRKLMTNYRHACFQGGKYRNDLYGNPDQKAFFKSLKVRSPRGARHWSWLSLAKPRIGYAYCDEGKTYLTSGNWLVADDPVVGSDPSNDQHWVHEKKGPNATRIIAKPHNLEPINLWCLRYFDSDNKEVRTERLSTVTRQITAIRDGECNGLWTSLVGLADDFEIHLNPVFAAAIFGGIKGLQLSAAGPLEPVFANTPEACMLMPMRNESPSAFSRVR